MSDPCLRRVAIRSVNAAQHQYVSSSELPSDTAAHLFCMAITPELILSLMISHDKPSSLTPETRRVWGFIISGRGPTAKASAAHSGFHGALGRWPREQCGALCWFWGPGEPNCPHLLAALLAWPRAPGPVSTLQETSKLSSDFIFVLRIFHPYLVKLSVD